MEQLFKRARNNPIVQPSKDLSWANSKVYNPGVVYHQKRYHLFFRAIGEAWVSKIGHAVSENGLDFEIEHIPALSPDEHFEKNGLEDPRITKIEDRFLMTYTAYDGECARLALASSLDLNSWHKHGLIFENWDAKAAGSFSVEWDSAQHTKEARKHWHKAGAIFPEKIGSRYWMLFGDRNIWLASSLDGRAWTPEFEPLLKPRPGMFDNAHIEMGPPPLKTRSGWLCFYHGIDQAKTYRLGAVLLDKNQLRLVLNRTEKALFEPRDPWELKGLVDILPGGLKAMQAMEPSQLDGFVEQALSTGVMPQVVFCPGACLVNGRIKIYYGASDTYVCQAEADLEEVLKIILS